MLMSNMYNKYYKQYGVYLAILIGALSLGVLGWFGYSWYVKKYEESASKDLSESIDAFYKVFMEKNNVQWDNIEQAFAVSAKRHEKSVLYPYFLAYQAEALIREKKLSQAVNVMDTMLASLDKKQILYPLYAIKRARIKMDMQDPEVQKSGQQELDQLAQDSQNPFQDMAIYYQGLDLWYKNNKEQAQKVWNELISKGKRDSQWYHMAQNKLAQEL